MCVCVCVCVCVGCEGEVKKWKQPWCHEEIDRPTLRERSIALPSGEQTCMTEGYVVTAPTS